jgi:hypothetical protein
MRSPILQRRPLWLPNRFSPGCQCCGSCPNCDANGTPSVIPLSWAGVANNFCATCTNWNSGTYALQQNQAFYSGCAWLATYQQCSINHNFLLYFQGTGTSAYWELNVNEVGGSWYFRSAPIGTLPPWDCSATYTLTYAGGGIASQCDWTGATATIN